MPARILADYTNLQNSRRVVYEPDTEGDPYAAQRNDPRRPLGNVRPGGVGSRARLHPAPRFIVAADIAQAVDYTAVVALERLPGRTYQVPMVTRAPPNTPYPRVVDRLIQISSTPPFLGACHLVVDSTGVGRPILDMLRSGPVPPVGVSITGGQHPHGGGLAFSAPKRDLIASAALAFQSGRLQIAAGADHAETLVKELTAFQVKISAAGNDTYSAPSGEHDDLVLALAIGLWWGDLLQARQDRVAPRPAT